MARHKNRDEIERENNLRLTVAVNRYIAHRERMPVCIPQIIRDADLDVTPEHAERVMDMLSRVFYFKSYQWISI